MSETLAPVHEDLEQLRSLVDGLENPAERQGLEAFIECVSPHLVEEATTTFLGKIAQIVMAKGVELPESATSEEALDALREHFDVVIED